MGSYAGPQLHWLNDELIGSWVSELIAVVARGRHCGMKGVGRVRLPHPGPPLPSDVAVQQQWRTGAGAQHCHSAAAVCERSLATCLPACSKHGHIGGSCITHTVGQHASDVPIGIILLASWLQ